MGSRVRPTPPTFEWRTQLPGAPAGSQIGVCLRVQLDCSETWRYAGPFTRWNRFKMALPGLGTATVAFAAYCAYEALFMKDDHHHGGEHHGNDHH